MASFTRIGEDEVPSIIVHADHKISKINDNIYGGFTEWVTSCAEVGEAGQELTSAQAYGALHIWRHLRPREP